MEIPLFEVEFDKSVNLVEPRQEADVQRYLTTEPGNGTTDVIVLAHGWNNDMNDARTLFRGFLRELAAFVPAATRNVAAIGVLWPSKKFAAEELIPGGAASATGGPLEPVLRAQIDTFEAALDNPSAAAGIARLRELLPRLEGDRAAQVEFVRTAGTLLSAQADGRQAAPEEGSARIEDRDGPALLADLARPLPRVQAAQAATGGAASLGSAAAAAPSGGAAGLGTAFSSLTAGALRLLNLTPYYVMKDRAGAVGRDGLNPLLGRLQDAVPNTIRFHLAGHSFGGRLVTAAVDGSHLLRIHTLLLLQAAFSHNGFAARYDGTHDGFFRNVVAQRKVAGRILVTHSIRDRAVGQAYPLASRLNGESAASFGGPDDRFGGIGRNGAQHVSDLSRELPLQAANRPYTFDPGAQIFNLNADNIIMDHSDIVRPETAWALAQSAFSA
ncbi:MAG TPA: hypothetical protein VHA11_15390 [Bryobacteraceae bacterium]|nr:hypothetical protein [Bryobacteraceae bacterium]